MKIGMWEIAAENESITPLSWALRFDAGTERFELEVIDLWRVEQPTLASAELAMSATAIADFEDDDPDEFAGDILQGLVSRLRAFPPDSDVGADLHAGLVKWIVDVRAAAAREAYEGGA